MESMIGMILELLIGTTLQLLPQLIQVILDILSQLSL